MPDILVAGATGAVGAALLARARDAGWNAVGVYRGNAPRAEEIAHSWLDAPGTLRLIAHDLTEESGVDALLAELGHDYCPEVLAHAVGIPLHVAPVQKTSWGDIETQMDGVLKPVVLLTRPLLRLMLRRGSGRIIAAASEAVAGDVPPRGFAAYAAAKQALRSYMRSLASECADRGIAVNTVSPGAMDSAMLAHLPGLLRDQMRAAAGGSWTDPDDVADRMFWLAATAGPDVTGRDFPVGTSGNAEPRDGRLQGD